MLIKKDKIIEIDGNIDEKDDIKLEVDPEEAEKLFELLFSSYSNARTALIREYTSNAWDAHAVIDSKEPVVVKIDEDDSGWYIEFIDKGVGMSAEFIEKVFSKLLKSTKNQDNKQIGGYGIGSKSGLGYVDQVLITTVQNCISNTYLLYKNEIGLPKISTLSKNDETEDCNGTTVKIILNENKSGTYSYEQEHRKFAESCATELAYFDNVVFEFNHWQIKGNADTYNNGKIIEGEYFKYRISGQYSNELHLILGRVAYPIDWKILGMSRISIAVGIKFEIGDLQVNMTREAIRYTDDAKTLIKAKIELTLKELKDIYNADNQPIEGLFDFIKARKRFNDEKVHCINLEVEENIYKLDISYLSDSLNEIVYAPISHLPIKLDNSIMPYFFLGSSFRIKDGKFKGNGEGISALYDRHNLRIAVYKEKNLHGKEFAKYIQNCLFIRQTKIIGKTDYNSWKEKLGFPKIQQFFYNEEDVRLRHLIRHRSRNINHDNDPIKIDGAVIGIAKTIYEYKKIILRELAKECQLFIGDFDNFEIPQEWKDEQKRIVKENRTIKPKIEGIISHKDLLRGTQYDLDLKQFQNYKGFIIYGFLKDGAKLRMVQKFCMCFKSLRRVKNNKKYRIRDFLNSKAVNIFRIAINNEKLLQRIPKTIHVDTFMKTNSRLIIRLLMGYEIYDKFHTLFSDESTMNVLEVVCPYTHQQLVKVKKFYDKFDNENLCNFKRTYKEVYEELLEIQKQYKDLGVMGMILDDLEMRPVVTYLDKYFEGCELLFNIKYSALDSIGIDKIAEFLKDKHKVVNVKYYVNERTVKKLPPESTFSYISPFFGTLDAVVWEGCRPIDTDYSQPRVDSSVKNIIIVQQEQPVIQETTLESWLQETDEISQFLQLNN